MRFDPFSVRDVPSAPADLVATLDGEGRATLAWTRPFQGLQAYCQTQYEVIVTLCKTNADYLKMLMPKLEKHAHEQERQDDKNTP